MRQAEGSPRSMILTSGESGILLWLASMPSRDRLDPFLLSGARSSRRGPESMPGLSRARYTDCGGTRMVLLGVVRMLPSFAAALCAAALEPAARDEARLGSALSEPEPRMGWDVRAPAPAGCC